MDDIGSAFFEHSPHVSHKALARQQRKAVKDAKRPGAKPLQPKTPRQAEYISLLEEGESVFAIGGAGTGKTYIPARIAAKALHGGKIDRIFVARATVTKDKHRLGFLPGGLEQKLAPWLAPVIEGLRAEVSGQVFDQWKAEGKLQFLSFEHLRGRTLSDAFIILDEAQNCDLTDLQLFLTRIGENAQVVVTGDIDQTDIANSGLERVLDLVETHDVPISIIEFDADDVVRSALAKAFVKAFAAEKQCRDS